MQIILAAPEPELAEAWERFCGDLDFVQIYRGSILELTCDAVVSPANSFGFMDGGLDALYTTHFGLAVQERVQRLIRDRHHGELLVGMADLIETGNTKIPYLISAPTMRVPMELKNSVNAYLAARAVLLLICEGYFSEGKFRGEPIRKYIKAVALPGLGTGIGKIGFNTCAHQVRAAIEDVLINPKNFPKSWVNAHERHRKLVRDFNFD
jgi:O-acetyl-ADP-ribose deacetylase (regulator of RNase III)